MISNATHISLIAFVSFIMFSAETYSQKSKHHEFLNVEVSKNEIGINIAPFLPFFYYETGLYKSNYLTFLQSFRYKRHTANNNFLRFQFDYSPTVLYNYSITGLPFFPHGLYHSVLRQYDSTQLQITRHLESHYFGLSFGLEKQFFVRRFINSVRLDVSIGTDFVAIESRLDSVRINPLMSPLPLPIANLETEINSCTNIISGLYLIYEFSYPIYKRLFISGQIGLGINYVKGKDMRIIKEVFDIDETYSSKFFIDSKMKNNICLKYLF